MARTGAAAKSAALAKVGKSCMPGKCLQEVRGIFAIGSRYPSAIAAWNASGTKHTGRPPAGAVVPVFFHSSSPYRHVAVALGDGRVVTINGSRWALYSSIDAMAKAWGAPYMGYTTDLNGVTLYTAPPPQPTYGDITALQRAVGASPDNVWGPDSNKRLNAIRAYSGWKGGQTPYGAKYLQAVLGVTQDGVLGKKSNAAHDAAVRRIQAAVGVKQDSIYGPGTDAAVNAAISKAHRA